MSQLPSTEIDTLILLKKSRDNARAFLGADYDTRIDEYKDVIRLVKKANNCNAFFALGMIMETAVYTKSGHSPACFNAAALDIFEFG